MRTKKATHAAGICDGGIALDERPAARACAEPPKLDDWQTRTQARRLGRELRRPVAGAPPLPTTAPQSRRLDPPSDLFDRAPAPLPPAVTSTVRRTQGRQVAAWLFVLVGLVALCGGLGGVGWSLFHEDYRYWNASLGLTLAGQGGLIFGLVLVVTRLWRSSRYASNKLLDVHARLGELQRTAEALAAYRGGAPAFYADLARGAPPQMLLSNLRGQIDQLATRFGAG